MMNIQSLKRWHWMAVGLVAGLALGLAKLAAAANQQIGGEGFIPQAAFEGALHMPPQLGKPRVASIVIHPAREVDLVSLRLLDQETLEYRDAMFAAPRPYRPLGQRVPPSAAFRVADFLVQLATVNSSISFHYAWWEAPPMLLTIYGLLGMAAVGGIWPSLIRFMVGAGLGRKEPDYDLDRFHHGPEPRKDQTATAADLARLAELEKEMMRGMQGGPAAAAREDAAAPVRQLADDAAEPLAPATADADKQFAGEFYPVEKKAPHGFTLVEILVVVGIIICLVGILMPTLARIREMSLRVKCASNLRQIGSGLELYNQSRGHLPFVPTPTGLSQALAEMKIAGIMVCPADEVNRPDYSMNAAFAGMPKSMGNPGDMLASETGARHDGRSNTLFFDGHVDDQ